MTDAPDLPQPLTHVAAIPAYVPGRPPAPREGVETYKLSSNENPYPPLPGVLEAATAAVERMNRYPDMGMSALYEALAARLDVEPANLAAGTGAVAGLYHLLAAFAGPGDEVVYAWRSFEAYPIAVTAAGAASVRVPVDADGRHDLAAMAAAVTDATRIVIVCSPNNPTGPAARHTEVAELLRQVPSRVLVVLDEAYTEFVRDEDPLDSLALAREHANVVVMRTFAKAYGLAGLRVGYAVASQPVAAAIRAVSLPFGVSQIAQAAAVASLEAEPALLDRVAGLVAERSRVRDALREAGWPVPDPQGNFVWLAAGERTRELAAACEDAGVMVRPFAGEGVRVSIGETEANDVLIRVAAGMAPGRPGPSRD